jgi:uncharacterized protein YkwD
MEKLLGRSFLCIGIVCVFVLVSLPSHSNSAHAAPLAQSQQTPDLFFNELQVVYLTNLKRREAGLAPLRWNREISEAARWFAQNSVDGRNGSYRHGRAFTRGALIGF